MATQDQDTPGAGARQYVPTEAEQRAPAEGIAAFLTQVGTSFTAIDAQLVQIERSSEALTTRMTAGLEARDAVPFVQEMGKLAHDARAEIATTYRATPQAPPGKMWSPAASRASDVSPPVTDLAKELATAQASGSGPSRH